MNKLEQFLESIKGAEGENSSASLSGSEFQQLLGFMKSLPPAEREKAERLIKEALIIMETRLAKLRHEASDIKEELRQKEKTTIANLAYLKTQLK